MTHSISGIQSAINDLFDVNYGNISVRFIQPEMVKDAFRKKAKQCHPDRAITLGIDKSLLTTRFKKINDSYHILLKISENNQLLNQLIENEKRTKIKQYHPIYKNNNKPEREKIFYEGKIPARKLRFSEFLYYQGFIDWETMIKSLVWQYRNRPRFGEIAIDFNFINQNEIIQVFKNIKMPEKFGDAAVRLGLITIHQHNIILSKQLIYNNPIGKYFIENNVMESNKIYRELVKQRVHNNKF